MPEAVLPAFQLPFAKANDPMQYKKEMGVSSESCTNCGEMALFFILWWKVKPQGLVAPPISIIKEMGGPGRGAVVQAGIAPHFMYKFCFACTHREAWLYDKGGWSFQWQK